MAQVEIFTQLIRPTTIGNPVNVRRLVAANTFQTFKINFDSSQNAPNTKTTIILPGTDQIIFNNGVWAQPDVDNNFLEMAYNTLKVNRVLLSSPIIVQGQAFARNPIFTVGSSKVGLGAELSNNQASITLLTNTGFSPVDVNLTLPNGGQLVTLGSTTAYTQIQTFNAGLKTDSVNSVITNGNIVVGSTASPVIVTHPLRVPSLSANTNSSLILAGSGTGVVAFDSQGLKFTNGGSVLKDYTVNSFTSQITCGTFNSGNITVQYERIGDEVTLKFPPVTGTPNVDQIWIGTGLPAILKPSTDIIASVSLGISANVIFNMMYCKIRIATNDFAFSFGTDTGGFGNSGTCGWQNAWTLTYIIS